MAEEAYLGLNRWDSSINSHICAKRNIFFRRPERKKMQKESHHPLKPSWQIWVDCLIEDWKKGHEKEACIKDMKRKRPCTKEEFEQYARETNQWDDSMKELLD